MERLPEQRPEQSEKRAVPESLWSTNSPLCFRPHLAVPNSQSGSGPLLVIRLLQSYGGVSGKRPPQGITSEADKEVSNHLLMSFYHQI
jgi:hypothetical protein